MKSERNYRAETLSNAQRLLSDSVLLSENERNESAVILAVFAIEELGKYLIDCWGVKNEASKRKFPSHIEKQSATFVILHAKEVLDTKPKKFRARMNSSDKRIRRWGPYSEQLQWAKAGFYDNLRMVATYADEEPLWPEEIVENISEFSVEELHKFFKKAFLASRNKRAMEFGAVVYQNGLGDL